MNYLLANPEEWYKHEGSQNSNSILCVECHTARQLSHYAYSYFFLMVNVLMRLNNFELMNIQLEDTSSVPTQTKYAVIRHDETRVII